MSFEFQKSEYSNTASLYSLGVLLGQQCHHHHHYLYWLHLDNSDHSDRLNVVITILGACAVCPQTRVFGYGASMVHV